MYGGAPEQLRYMYGLGGLADGPAFSLQVPGFAQAAIAANPGALLALQQAAAGQLPAAQTAQTPAATADCECMLAVVQRAFSYSDTMMAQLRPLCATSPAQFMATAQAEAARRGMAIDFSAASCAAAVSAASVPWYQKPKYLAVAGIGVLTLGYIAWKVL